MQASNAQVAFVEVERDLGRRVAQEPTTARLYEREAYAVRMVTPTASTVTLPERFDVLAHVRTLRQGEVISTGRIVTPEGEHTLQPGERLIMIIRPDRFRATDWVVRSVVPVDRASDTITMGAFSLPAGTSAREVIAGLRAEALRVPSPGGAASGTAGGV